MAAYLVGHLTVKDPGLWKVYVEGVRETLAEFGGEVVFRGRAASVLAGRHEHASAVVIRFPGLEALRRWFESPRYQSLVPVRDRAAEVVLVAYEESA